jgi:hypothetical protein
MDCHRNNPALRVIEGERTMKEEEDDDDEEKELAEKSRSIKGQPAQSYLYRLLLCF